MLVTGRPRAGTGRELQSREPRSALALARVGAVCLATVAVVFLAGGGDAFWLCVPGALLVAATSASRAGVVLGAAAVVGAAAAPLLASPGLAAGPSPALALLVPAASVGVLLALRERLEREREVLRASALSDSLTGVANRRALLARIE